ncbi:hypothetical protein HanPI659440_Chr11g0428831 [Helianthus annuus]|nr:hypothetical protein HanPI659440_Chr11g0428831 [Helianthus annuus]
MNKRSKNTAKSNINTRRGINVACSTPRQHLPKQKTRDQKAEHAPCRVDTGACPSVCKKEKVVEASISQHGGMPSSTQLWSTLRFAESKQILIVQIRFYTRGRPSGPGGVVN